MSQVEFPEGFKPTPIKYPSHTILAGGHLPDKLGAHACFYYARCATSAMQKMDSGADYEGERDHVGAINNIARSVTALYGFDSPAEFLIFMDPVRMQAISLGYGWDPRIERPEGIAFVRTGN